MPWAISLTLRPSSSSRPSVPAAARRCLGVAWKQQASEGVDLVGACVSQVFANWPLARAAKLGVGPRIRHELQEDAWDPAARHRGIRDEVALCSHACSFLVETAREHLHHALGIERVVRDLQSPLQHRLQKRAPFLASLAVDLERTRRDEAFSSSNDRLRRADRRRRTRG